MAQQLDGDGCLAKARDANIFDRAIRIEGGETNAFCKIIDVDTHLYNEGYLIFFGISDTLPKHLYCLKIARHPRS